MIYQPTDGEILNRITECHPKTCFLMTQLSTPVPQVVTEIRKKLAKVLKQQGITLLDASQVIKGRDFLLKIWELILSVPMGVAIIDKGMKSTAINNVYYEIGVMQAYGKETLVVRTKDTKVPSDFIRTEYVTYDNLFAKSIGKFITSCNKQAKFYLITAQTLKKNPPLALDYYRRAYLMTGEKQLLRKAKNILQTPGYRDICSSCVALETSWMKV